MAKLKRGETIMHGCYLCTERKRREDGKPYCPHEVCPFDKQEIKWWKDTGGKTLIEVR